MSQRSLYDRIWNGDDGIWYCDEHSEIEDGLNWLKVAVNAF